MSKYKFTRYKKKYPRLFEKEKRKLMKILPNVKIEHIGSTAIEGLGGKGILDIMIIASKKDINKLKKKLIKTNYKFKESGGDKNRIFFYRDGKVLKKRRFHIHLTFENSKIQKQAIKFRDTLRKNKKLREEYSKIKQKAIKLSKEKQDYRDFKKSFIDKVSKK